MKTIPRRQASGFAMLVAIALLALVAMALGALATTLAYDFNRTRTSGSDAQLRQLLLAGAAEALQRAPTRKDDDSETRWSMSLPQALTAQGASIDLRLVPDGPDRLRAQIEAKLDRSSMRQTVALAKREGKWAISSAGLGE